MNPIRFLDLSVSVHERSHILALIDSSMESGELILGKPVEDFEKAIANYCVRDYAVGVGSGSDAVFLALWALDIGPGDEVITTSLSWIATANAIALTGATPVFADVADDLNLDVESVDSLITSRTKAVLAVDYTGRLASANSLVSLCRSRGIYLVEDGSQAIGASADGFCCGGYGDISAISHNPMKVLAALGEAGSVLTNNEEYYDRLKNLRYNGTINKEWLVKPSINARIDTIQAAILLYRLHSLNAQLSRRRENASIYNRLLSSLEYITVPHLRQGEEHAFYTYTLRVPDRDLLFGHLTSSGIECKVQHPILMPHQKPYSNCLAQTQNAITVRDSIISLPIHEKLTPDEISYICEKIIQFYTS
jgi:dTDP-4-amino-4,6-dideoxygalactose transaminase